MGDTPGRRGRPGCPICTKPIGEDDPIQRVLVSTWPHRPGVEKVCHAECVVEMFQFTVQGGEDA